MLTPFERILKLVSPARAKARISARLQIDAMMNYDAATRGRRTDGWKAPNTDADAAAYGSRQRLRSVSRDFIRNRPYAARAQSVVVANVVGSGVMPSIEADSESVAAEAMKMVSEHLMTSTIDALGVNSLPMKQRVVMSTVFADGELLVRLRPKSGRFAAGLPLPFTIELLEVDQLDHTITSNGQNEVIEGIEYDPVGAPLAYHIWRQHPGTVTSTFRRSDWESERVRAADILHIRRLDRPGQVRGVPWLAPALLTLGELSDYQEAQILKQRMAALLAFFVKTTDGGDAYQGAGMKDLAPGAIVGLSENQEVTPTDPPKVDEYEQFMHEGLRAVAMAVGITFESLSGYLRGVNFSSGRMGRMEMDKLVDAWQQQIMIDQFCAGVSRWFKAYAVIVSMRQGGALRHDNFALNWTAPRRALIDPTKEIPATIKSIEAGLTSLQREQRRLGNDPEQIAKERLEDQSRASTEMETNDAGK